MTSQMVSRFRVKKLSPKHPLPVYKESQLPDLSDPANLQRSVPQIETGVEKEEEEEHDLQAAISAAQAAVTTGAKVEKYIPTPDASRVIDLKEFTALYFKKFKEPSTLIRFSSTVEDCTGCPYCMDEEDDVFVKKLNSNLKPNTITEDYFESVMWELESITNQQLPHLHLDPTQLPDFDAFQSLVPSQSSLLSRTGIDEIFEHWRQRRSKRAGKSIIPVLQYEDLVKNEVDPYVCFRRRETKSIRKTRRTDQHSLERLRRLRNEMEMARNLLEMVLKREKLRKEGLVLDHSVFDKKCKFREYQRILGIKEDDEIFASSTKKKRKSSSADSGTGTTIKIPLNKLKRDGYDSKPDKSPMQLAIESELQRKKEQDAPYEDVTECPFQPFPKSTPQLFYSYLFPADPVTSKRTLYRKRHGRNGRLYLDRTERCKRHWDSTGGKSNPLSQAQLEALQRYRFDSDYSSDDDGEDDDYTRIDSMNNSSLQYRSQLLSEADLRNLTTIPLTPLNMMNRQKTSLHQQPSSSSSSSPIATAVAVSISQQDTPAVSGPASEQFSNGGKALTNGTSDNSSALSSTTIKRQNSNRNKMTPQQAALAMANGMIVANMSAAVNQNGQSKSAMQIPPINKNESVSHWV